jgi:zinc D-Ala-D-Ala carboxypeptidase|tara:strand:+ start:1662 stop:2117 length:456 start_codon:yes stop_codon:yes gene_type:complete
MISPHVSKIEGTKSITAIRLGIDNIPGEKEMKNMKLIATKIFEPLRKYVGGPIKINSFYRCPDLNKAIGGSKKSQHCQGRAMDIDDTFGVMSNSTMFNWIQDNLSYDQIIWEFGDEYNPDWVHVSYVNEESNRNRALQAYRENGKTKYKVI